MTLKALLLSLLALRLAAGQLTTQKQTNPVETATYTFQKFRDVSTCTCDKTAYVCNYFCCCDAECPAEKIKDWTSKKICLSSEPSYASAAQFPKCSAYKSNPQSAELLFNKANQLMCIKYDNTPYSGFFYNLLALSSQPTATQYDSSKSSLASVYMSNSPVLTTVTQFAPEAQVYYKSASDNKFMLTLPSADFGGLCNMKSPIKLFVNQARSCRTQITAAVCTSLQTKAYDASFDAVAQSSGTVPTVTESGKQAISSTGTVCAKTPVLTKYEFVLSDTQIQSVTVTYIQQDVTLGSFVRQKFEVVFRLATNDLTTSISFSGTPGYIYNYPLVVGDKSGTAITLPQYGYQLTLTDDGVTCASAASALFAETSYQPSRVIKFGGDIAAQCQVSLGAGSTPVSTYISTGTSSCTAQNYKYQQYFKKDTTHVQKYGMGDPADVYGWLAVERRTDAHNTKLCLFQKLVTVFYSQAGQRGKKQNYVVKVEESYPENAYYDQAVIAANGGLATGTLQVNFVEIPYDQLDPEQPTVPDIIKSAFGRFFEFLKQNRTTAA